MTEPRRNPPCQKALPFEKWSKADRETWNTAQEAAGLLDDGGVASHLSPRTLADLTSRYSYLLYFLAARGKLNHYGPAAASVTEENILDYVRFLEPRVSSVTLAMSLSKIARVAACLAPERDWRWLRRIVRRLGLRARPRDRRHEVVEIKELFRLGLRLMGQAEMNKNLTPFRRALAYRDGLIIALFAADPLRLANIAALEIGRTLIKDGTTWSFEIPAEETKERRLHLAILPDWCSPRLDRYVHHYRPLFRKGRPAGSGSAERAGRLARTRSLA
jgi:integrase/recombinase XerD